MTTGMEHVALEVALTALRTAIADPDTLLDHAEAEEAFRAGWPPEDSRRPMNDAMTAAGCQGQDPAHWKAVISRTWNAAVESVVAQRLESARRSFSEGDPLQGTDTLTDAVRATFGRIAAARDWPHADSEDLYCISAALASAIDWPGTMEDFQRALDGCTKQGEGLGAALGASLGLPESIKFGI